MAPVSNELDERFKELKPDRKTSLLPNKRKNLVENSSVSPGNSQFILRPCWIVIQENSTSAPQPFVLSLEWSVYLEILIVVAKHLPKRLA